MNSENTWNGITDFVLEMDRHFGKTQRSLSLYRRMVERTTYSSHFKFVTKHINEFKRFCRENKEAIFNGDESKLTSPKIVYSENVFIDMRSILEHAQSNVKSTIWKHLLVITHFIDPESGAKEVLLQINNRSSSSGSSSGDGCCGGGGCIGANVMNMIDNSTGGLLSFHNKCSQISEDGGSSVGSGGSVGNITDQFGFDSNTLSNTMLKMMGGSNMDLSSIESGDFSKITDMLSNSPIIQDIPLMNKILHDNEFKGKLEDLFGTIKRVMKNDNVVDDVIDDDNVVDKSSK